MDISAIALSGMQQAQSQLESTAKRLAGPGDPKDTVSLSTDAVSLLKARSDFQANLNALKVNDKMTQSLFDVLG